jgi:L-ascorbate metabolism protein UlaG (beta-lactamase superfamily)
MRRALALPVIVVAACSKAPPAPTGTNVPSAPPSVTSASPPAPSAPPAAPSPRATDHFPTKRGELSVVPLEHASVLFEMGGEEIYVDPTASAVTDPSLPKADIVFITDIHPDHLDPAGLDKVRKAGTQVVGPKAVADKTHVDVVMVNGDTRQIGDVVATAVPMYNLKRGPSAGQLYHDKGRGNGYEFDFGGVRVYVSGDTECTPEMKLLEKIDAAFVCMNLPYTMPPAEAAECVAAFKPKVLFPYHYRGSDLGVLDTALAGKGVEIRKREWYPAAAK